MKKLNVFLAGLLLTATACSNDAKVAQDLNKTVSTSANEEIVELDPNAADIEDQLAKMDAEYESLTGESAFIDSDESALQDSGCYRKSCKIYLDVSKNQQIAYLYVDGALVGEFKVSSGTGNRTPNFDKHPNGRIYSGRYSSRKYPGGNYVDPAGNLLGNMPYAVFIDGGFAVHGTPQGNWSKLGTKASHGCIRMHPENAVIFNRLVREHGIYNTWITVRN